MFVSALQPLAMPLTLTLSPHGGERGHFRVGGNVMPHSESGRRRRRASLLPASGEKVADRPDEGLLPTTDEGQLDAYGEHP